MPEEQRRGRRIAMSGAELDRFLGEERTCRVATVGADGRPHNTPLWYVWDGQALWLHSIVKSQRWVDMARDPSVSVVVDAGSEYFDLRGAELMGALEQVGEAPMGSTVPPDLEAPATLFAEKYLGSSRFSTDGKHGWLRLRPRKVVSWDFRKIAGTVDAAPR